MEVKHDNKTYKLAYSFNSFRFMEDLDLGALSELERKPFKIIPIVQTLLMGALNPHPNKFVDEIVVLDILEQQTEDGTLMELLDYLINLLQESSFFKNLQSGGTKKVTKK